MASGHVEQIREMLKQIPGHSYQYYADAVDAGLSIEDVKAGRVEAMRRYMVIPIYDERTTYVTPYEHRGDPNPGEQSELLHKSVYDVPPDGQLAQDVHRVTNRTLQPSRYIHEDYNKSREAAARLRAAFGLDEGSE